MIVGKKIYIFFCFVLILKNKNKKDPVRTLTCGKVEIGAFRTYPPNYVPPDSQITVKKKKELKN